MFGGSSTRAHAHPRAEEFSHCSLFHSRLCSERRRAQWPPSSPPSNTVGRLVPIGPSGSRLREPHNSRVRCCRRGRTGESRRHRISARERESAASSSVSSRPAPGRPRADAHTQRIRFRLADKSAVVQTTRFSTPEEIGRLVLRSAPLSTYSRLRKQDGRTHVCSYIPMYIALHVYPIYRYRICIYIYICFEKKGQTRWTSDILSRIDSSLV